MVRPRARAEFTTRYLIEKALAVDNIFVFVVVFSTFNVPAVYQHRSVLALGALSCVPPSSSQAAPAALPLASTLAASGDHRYQVLVRRERS
jgi:hypothetical protein